MSTGKNSSGPGEPGDVKYTLPNIAEVYAKAGLEFAGKEWLRDAAYRQSDEVLAGAASLDDVVSQDQLKAAKGAALTEIESAISLAPSSKEKAELSHLRDKILHAKSGSEIKQLLVHASSAMTEASAGKAETAEEKKERLWARIKEIDNEQIERIRQLQRDGYLTAKQAEEKIAIIRDADEHPDDKAKQDAATQAQRDAAKIATGNGASPAQTDPINTGADDRESLRAERDALKLYHGNNQENKVPQDVEKSPKDSVILSQKSNAPVSAFAVASVVETPTDLSNSIAAAKPKTALETAEATHSEPTSKGVPFAVAAATTTVNLRGS
jgi:hypothetical protein